MIDRIVDRKREDTGLGVLGVMIMVADMRFLVAHVRGQLSLCAQTIGHMPFARAYVASYPHEASINYVGCPVWMDIDTLSRWQGMVIF